MISIENHPCFNPGACKSNGRVHLPVAPACNMQCKYCNRSYDCVNESRPGVVSSILKPHQALYYLNTVMDRMNISVVGIAGPGDPFANPSETLETLELVRRKYPEILLCLATNGLNLLPFVDDLAKLDVSHVTLTVNAVDPEVGQNLYSWMRVGPRRIFGEEAAAYLIDQQEQSILRLKSKGVIVKVNTVIVPGINDLHAEEVAKKAQEWGVDAMNCMALIPVPGSGFEDMPAPDGGDMILLRKRTGEYMKQMSHCRRCRADAAGLLGENNQQEISNLLKEAASMPLKPDSFRPCVAVGTREGMMVNQHLGETAEFTIYQKVDGRYRYLERRKAPEPGVGDTRWFRMAEILKDCDSILVSGIGKTPRNILEQEGCRILIMEGIIEEALELLASGKDLSFLARREWVCSGDGGGCMSG